jgi:hypothetical protein
MTQEFCQFCGKLGRTHWNCMPTEEEKEQMQIVSRIEALEQTVAALKWKLNI